MIITFLDFFWIGFLVRDSPARISDMKNKKLKDTIPQSNTDKCPALLSDNKHIQGNHQFIVLSSTQTNDEYLPTIHCYTTLVCKYCNNIQNEYKTLNYGLEYLLADNKDINIIQLDSTNNS
jgi:hypothetical protein